jgi:hypothetical protein
MDLNEDEDPKEPEAPADDVNNDDVVGGNNGDVSDLDNDHNE